MGKEDANNDVGWHWVVTAVHKDDVLPQLQKKQPIVETKTLGNNRPQQQRAEMVAVMATAVITCKDVHHIEWL